MNRFLKPTTKYESKYGQHNILEESFGHFSVMYNGRF